MDDIEVPKAKSIELSDQSLVMNASLQSLARDKHAVECSPFVPYFRKDYKLLYGS